jgi:putative spermidine/putrescine transport system permease protein
VRWGWLIFIPVFLFLLLFAIIPAVGILLVSIYGNHGLTLSFYEQTFTSQYMNAFLTTTLLSLYSSVVAMIWGFAITWSVMRTPVAWVQHLITALSSTMANFAGLPLAVAFMATLGTSGILTVIINQLFHVNLVTMGWNIASFSGLFVAYLSFLTPLSVILMIPAVGSLLKEWEEAAYTLGAPLSLYLRKVAVPVLFPSMVSTFALLFANAFSTYVTSYELAGGSVNLVPILIGYMVNGNVSMNLGLGDALSMEEMVVLGGAIVLYFLAQRFSLLHARGGGSLNAK